MFQDEAQLFISLADEIKLASVENARRKADVHAAIDKAKQQIADARELLAQLDTILRLR